MALALPLRWVLCGGGLTCQCQVGLPNLPCRSPGQGWMGPAQPSKLLFLFMILFPLEEIAGACCFNLTGWFSVGLATCNERSWEIPTYFTVTLQKQPMGNNF